MLIPSEQSNNSTTTEKNNILCNKFSYLYISSLYIQVRAERYIVILILHKLCLRKVMVTNRYQLMYIILCYTDMYVHVQPSSYILQLYTGATYMYMCYKVNNSKAFFCLPIYMDNGAIYNNFEYILKHRFVFTENNLKPN